MPTRERVQEFIARMQRGESLELMPEFYTDDATAQENNEPPRVGLAVLQAHERAALARTSSVKPEALSVIVDGDRVVLHWLIEFVSVKGHTMRLDELSLQHWRGDKIASERFFYDPSQLRPKAAG